MDLSVQLGFHVSVNERFRLHGIDTPEVYGPNRSEEGQEASAFVKNMLPEGTKVRVNTSKGKGKYGRWLAVVWLGDDEKSVNDQIVEAGHAVRYDGGKR